MSHGAVRSPSRPTNPVATPRACWLNLLLVLTDGSHSREVHAELASLVSQPQPTTDPRADDASMLPGDYSMIEVSYARSNPPPVRVHRIPAAFGRSLKEEI
jgi:hypothetical protein